MTLSWDGILPVDKPSGPTSHDVVARVRRALGGVRAGHTGTLDPPATGLLIVVLGAATRLARFLPSAPKVYAGTFVLGVSTSTDDLDGELIRRHDGPIPSAVAVAAAGAQMTGPQRQVAPSVSAKSVGGRRLYALARAGRTVAAPVSDVVIERCAVSPTDRPEIWRYEMAVSEGTYVRAVIRDIGRKLGCGAAVATLRRLAIGPWDVAGALALDGETDLCATAPRFIVPLDALPMAIPSVVLAIPEDCRRFSLGAPVFRVDGLAGVSGAVAVRDADGALLGVGRGDGDRLQPDVVLPSRAEGAR